MHICFLWLRFKDNFFCFCLGVFNCDIGSFCQNSSIFKVCFYLVTGCVSFGVSIARRSGALFEVGIWIDFKFLICGWLGVIF